MYLVQLFLPVYDNNGEKFGQTEYVRVRSELADRFGGLTAYLRSPATGLWKPEKNTTIKDEVVVYEVMVKELENAWWDEYKGKLSARFRQEMLLIRALPIQLI